MCRATVDGFMKPCKRTGATLNAVAEEKLMERTRPGRCHQQGIAVACRPTCPGRGVEILQRPFLCVKILTNRLHLRSTESVQSTLSGLTQTMRLREGPMQVRSRTDSREFTRGDRPDLYAGTPRCSTRAVRPGCPRGSQTCSQPSSPHVSPANADKSARFRCDAAGLNVLLRRTG